MYSFLSSSNEAVKFNVENLKRKHCQVNVLFIIDCSGIYIFFFSIFYPGTDENDFKLLFDIYS